MEALRLLKARLNLYSNLKDEFLEELIESSKASLKALYGFEYAPDKKGHTFHLVLYAELVYKGETKIPTHLRHFFISGGSKDA